MRLRLEWVLVSAFLTSAVCCSDPAQGTAGPAERIPVSAPSAFDRFLDRARVEAGRGNWKGAMTEAQAAFRERPEHWEARAFLEAFAPRVWAEWEREIARRSEYSTDAGGISVESMEIRKYLRDGQRFESAGMLGEALEKFREAEVRILLLPPEPYEHSPEDCHRMAREAIARLSPSAERKR